MLHALLAAMTMPSPSVLAIENVIVVSPGYKATSDESTVLINKGQFTQVGPATKVIVPAGAVRIDGRGKYLIPGLWDMHVHWYDENSLGLFTANGVTGVRLMFGSPAHLEWRKKVADGSLTGPRIVAGGPIVDGPEPLWPGSIAAKGQADAASIVKRHKSESWDFMKVYSYLGRASYIALAKEAKKQGVPFAGHIPMTVSLLEAAKLGHRSNEHLTGFRFDLWSKAPEMRAKIIEAAEGPNAMQKVGDLMAALPGEKPEPFDMEKVRKLAKALAKTKMWQCPTLTVHRALAHLDQKSFTHDGRLKFMPKSIRESWDPANDFRLKENKPEDWATERELYRMRMSLVKPLLEAGNRFLAGTDCLNPYCFPGFSLHDELALLVEAGLSPTQAIEAATINPARFFGEDRKWGRVAKGMRADAVLLSRDPLADIRNTRSIEMVFQGGKSWDRPSLDALLKANEKG